MSNALTIIRSLIIYSLCLPLAIVLGYKLAMPMDAMSFTIVVMAVALPLIPLLLKHHHLMLFLVWNTNAVLFFLPGRPGVFMVMAGVSLLIAVLQHTLNRNIRFVTVPSVVRPLIFLTLVIIVTANLTGGFGARLTGGSAYGGKRYFTLLASILGYFALTCFRVPRDKSMLYVALYFLGGISTAVGNLAPFVDSRLYFIFAIFPVESLSFLQGGAAEDIFSMRLGGLAVAASTTVYYIFARHGVRGLFDFSETWRLSPIRFRGGLGFNNPWRPGIFLILVWIGLLGGYRSTLLILALTFFIQFYLEGLFRTQLLPALVLTAILVFSVSLPLVHRMPIGIQRALSFLPIEVDPVARYAAESTVEWRLQLWRSVLPMVPHYLLLGKGYSINANELEIAAGNEQRTGVNTAETAILAGDYHNGPLSVIIPLGIFGAIGFLWFLWAGYRVLLNNYRHGDPELRLVNTFILAFFLARVMFFCAIFGAFYSELMVFTGLIGLSVSINGGVRSAVPEPEEKPVFDQFKLVRAVR